MSEVNAVRSVRIKEHGGSVVWSAKPVKSRRPCCDFHRVLFSEVWGNDFHLALIFSRDTIWHCSFCYEP